MIHIYNKTAIAFGLFSIVLCSTPVNLISSINTSDGVTVESIAVEDMVTMDFDAFEFKDAGEEMESVRNAIIFKSVARKGFQARCKAMVSYLYVAVRWMMQSIWSPSSRLSKIQP